MGGNLTGIIRLLQRHCDQVAPTCLVVLWLVPLDVGHAEIEVQAMETLPPPGAVRVFVANASSPSAVGNRLGVAGGPQVWDFREGPNGSEYRYDYVDLTGDEVITSTYVGAEVGEKLTINDAEQSDWTVFRLGSTGKENIGFYVPNAASDVPEAVFSEPLTEVPQILKQGTVWQDSTLIPGVFLTFPVTTQVEQWAEVDAWGAVRLPSLGDVEALRVNMLSRWTTVVLGLPSVHYLRTYFWYARDLGIVASITSQNTTGPTPTEFANAERIQRLSYAEGFRLYVSELNHHVTETGNLEITWDGPDFGACFQIESSGVVGNWNPLTTTIEERATVPMIGERHFYRVVAKSNP